MTADEDIYTDRSTVKYVADGTGTITTPESVDNILWQTNNGQITTIIADSTVVWTKVYAFDKSPDQVVLTIVANGKTVSQNYHRVTENFPQNLKGNWGSVTVVVNGQNKPSMAMPDLRLEANGGGSVLWCVSDGALVLRDPATQLGAVYKYELTSGALVLTKEDDTGLTVATYYDPVSGLPPPPVNAQSVYNCSISQGFNFNKDAQILVGYINYIKISGKVLDADFNVTDPEDASKLIKIVGVASSISWGGGYADPISFQAQVSTDNKNVLANFIHKSMSNTEVEFSFTIYDYDPKAKKYFKCFHTYNINLKGLVAKSGGELSLSIDMDASTRSRFSQELLFLHWLHASRRSCPTNPYGTFGIRQICETVGTIYRQISLS